MKAIPQVLHQTYKDENLPAKLSGLQSSWLRHNPHWEYRFWSDEDIKNFIARDHPKFLPIFRRYPHNIMRVDVFRYFLLYHYGGIYADLDYECLRPMDNLLKGRDIFLVPEPSIHLAGNKAKIRNFPYIVSNAFMASTPRHPFWRQIIKHLYSNPQEIDLLDVTGPFMLTAMHHKFKPRISLAKKGQFDAIHSDPKGRVSKNQSELAYAQHHWLGSWWKGGILTEQLKGILRALRYFALHKISINYKLRDYLAKRGYSLDPQAKGLLPSTSLAMEIVKGRITKESKYNLKSAAKRTLAAKKLPLVSAMLITKDRPQLAWRAIESFMAQSYPNKELVVIDEGGYELHKKLRVLGDLTKHGIVYSRNEVPCTLGELRNRSIAIAQGDYVCQWDDDDLYHKDRLLLQIAACLEYDASASFLLRESIMREEPQSLPQLAISGIRLWEGSVMVKRRNLPRYPEWKRAEDSPFTHRLVAKTKVVGLDLPGLYIYRLHGGNTWDAGHMKRVWGNASRQFFLSDERDARWDLLCRNYPQLSAKNLGK